MASAISPLISFAEGATGPRHAERLGEAVQNLRKKARLYLHRALRQAALP